MKKKMSIMGIGPKLALVTILYLIPVIIINNLEELVFTINIIPFIFLAMVGALLIITDIPFLLISVFTIKKVYKQDILYTKGIYSVCRHPIYSSWILFIIPGIMLFFKSWLLISIPIVMYFLFRIMIKKEESYLEEKFGSHYINYKNELNLLFPVFWKYSKK
jgi:protein-S-isoprenylcysteine O-methyltransferase Ste14